MKQQIWPINENKDTPGYFEEAEKDLYYLWTSVDIQNKRGQEVPVMVSYTDSTGEKVYAVANVTVTKGDSNNYNVISGNPRPNNENFSMDHLLGDKADYGTSYDEAYVEYKARLESMK